MRTNRRHFLLISDIIIHTLSIVKCSVLVSPLNAFELAKTDAGLTDKALQLVNKLKLLGVPTNTILIALAYIQ